MIDVLCSISIIFKSLRLFISDSKVASKKRLKSFDISSDLLKNFTPSGRKSDKKEIEAVLKKFDKLKIEPKSKELAEFRKNSSSENKVLVKDKTTLFEDKKDKESDKKSSQTESTLLH